MSANRLFLVCSKHPSIEDALLIADRQDANSQYTAAMPKRADDWFAKHQRCAPGCDHYQLAYHRPQDHDAPKGPPALTPAAGGVKLALVKGLADAAQQQLNGSKSE